MVKHNQNIDQLEKLVKGFANHWRIWILELLGRESELSLIDITERLGANFKTISEHVKKMTAAGLVIKRYEGLSVKHKLSDKGKQVLRFLKNF